MMAEQRSSIEFTVDGRTIAALTAGPAASDGKPLIAALTAAPYVDASIARATGHSIDHHILGHALHLRQLAFAEECQLWARQQS
jgi:hypothetical protein